MILKFFYRPQEAFRELNERVAPGSSVLLFLAVTAAACWMVRPTPEQTQALEKVGAHLPHYANLTMLRIVLVPLALAWVTAMTLGLHLAADLNGGNAPFSKLWNAMLWVTSVEILISVALPSAWPVRLILFLGKAILLCVAIAVIYNLGPGRAIWSYVLGNVGSVIALSVVVFGVVMVTILPAARNALSRQAQPVLSAVHMPAEYGWLLQNPDGTYGKMDQYKGRVTVLNIWATWCAPCRAEMPSLERLYQKARQQGIEVLGVTNERPEVLKGFLKGKSILFKLFCHPRPMPPIFAAAVLPTTFVISEDGYVVAQHQGAANWDDPTILTYLTSLKGRHFAGGELSMGLGPAETANLILRQADWDRSHNELDQAIAYFHKGLQLIAQEPIPSALSMGIAYNGLGNVYFKEGRYAEALHYHEQGVSFLRKAPDVNATDMITALRNVKNDDLRMNRPADADRAEQQVKIIEKAASNK
jgi:thiol-disulfide isomerase/thioredoxin